MSSYLAAGLDPCLFAQEVRLDPDPWQTTMLRTQRKRIILNCARQTGKSTITAASAEHRAIFFPGSLILIISPSLKQSMEVFKKICDIRLLERYPLEMVEDTKTSCVYTNGSRILCLPGSESSIRGYSAPDMIIIDECARVDQAVLDALRPMLATTPDSKLVLLSTPNGKNNEFARVWFEHDTEWLKIGVVAKNCPRISAEFLAREKLTLAPWIYKREYECSFDEPAGSLFRMDDINNAIDTSVKPLFGGHDTDTPALVSIKTEKVFDTGIPVMGAT